MESHMTHDPPPLDVMFWLNNMDQSMIIILGHTDLEMEIYCL